MTPTIKDSFAAYSEALGCRVAPRPFEIADRPPDAALSLDDSMDMLRRKVEMAMAQRDSLLAEIKELERQRATLERHFSRSVAYWSGKWASARRTIKLLICIGGSIMAVETLALVGLIWRLL